MKHFRAKLGWSQTELGEKIGVTFQQIQKYEKGVNRIAASTLYRLSKLMNVQVSDFFAGLDVKDKPAALSKDEAVILRLYGRISDENFRRSVKAMLKSFAANQDDAPESLAN